MLDQLDASIVLYDSDDRLVMANRRFRDRLREHAEHLVPGTPYDRLARQALGAGHVLEAVAGPTRGSNSASSGATHRTPSRCASCVTTAGSASSTAAWPTAAGCRWPPT
jgi:hypothetical protein